MYRVNARPPEELIVRVCSRCRDLARSCKCRRSHRGAMLGVCFLAVILSGLMGGCGDVMVRYHQAVSTTAIAAMGCRETLSEANDKKVAEIRGHLATLGPEAAQRELDAWRATHDKINTACKSAKAGAQIAMSAAPALEAGLNKKKDAMGWIARLVKLGADVIAALDGAGLKLPGGGP